MNYAHFGDFLKGLKSRPIILITYSNATSIVPAPSFIDKIRAYL